MFGWLMGSSNVDAVKTKLSAGAQLVDVRTPGEYAEGHLRGAKNIPVQDLAGRLAQLDKSKPVVVYCRSGARSAQARSILQGAGFADVTDGGGIGSLTSLGMA